MPAIILRLNKPAERVAGSLGRSQLSDSDGKRMIFAPIVGLLFCGGPSAIFWAVSLLWVNAIYGTAVRAISHVGNERFKRLPSMANSDASTAVQIVLVVGRAVASGSHVYPGVVCWRRVCAIFKSAVLYPAFASARFVFSGLQCIARKLAYVSAFAPAYPANAGSALIGDRRFRNYSQETKRLSEQVDLFAHTASG